MSKSQDKDDYPDDSGGGMDDMGDAPAATKPKVNYGKEFLHCAGNNDTKRVVEIIEMGKRTGDDYINYQSKIGNSGLLQAAVSVVSVLYQTYITLSVVSVSCYQYYIYSLLLYSNLFYDR
jgi:hypothetical protein